MEHANTFWEHPDQVKRFAERAPDRRLLELLKTYHNPENIRVLDLGCAGGRNSVVLAEKGFDFFAIDSSNAMIGKTRERVTPLIGRENAIKRVFPGRMENLQDFSPETFHLVIALGVYHHATSQQQWEQALEETARILLPNGHLLVANFSPRSNPTGKGLTPVEGKWHVYEGFGPSQLLLLEAEELDAQMSRYALFPLTPTQTVTTQMDSGDRVTINAHYVKQRK